MDLILFNMLVLAVMHWVALVTPGPDFLLVMHCAVSRSRHYCVAVVLGITLGVMCWAGLALMGVEWLFTQFVGLHRLLLLLGGLYLCTIGIQLIRSVQHSPLDFAQVGQDLQSVLSAQPIQPEIASLRQGFYRGMWTNLSNPKAFFYFSSVFSAFLHQSVGSHQQGLLFILVSVETFLWFMAVVFVVSLPAVKAAYQRASKWIDGLSGVIFLGFGLYVLARLLN